MQCPVADVLKNGDWRAGKTVVTPTGIEPVFQP